MMTAKKKHPPHFGKYVCFFVLSMALMSIPLISLYTIRLARKWLCIVEDTARQERERQLWRYFSGRVT